MLKESDEQDVDIVLGKFIAYMDSALLHRRINYLKRVKYIEKVECGLNDEEWEVLSADDNEAHSFFSEEKLYELFEDEHIAKAFKNLTSLQQKILCWNIVEKIPYKKISEKLGVSVNSVVRAKDRALKSLSKKLEGYKDVKKD